MYYAAQGSTCARSPLFVLGASQMLNAFQYLVFVENSFQLKVTLQCYAKLFCFLFPQEVKDSNLDSSQFLPILVSKFASKPGIPDSL